MSVSPTREAACSVLAALPVIMRTVGRCMRESGGEVSPQQYRILTLLSCAPRTLSQVAHIQGVTPATATTMVTTLEHRGWVRRDVDTLDRRRVVVSMTETGQAALDSAQEVAENAVADLLSPLGERELTRLADALEVIRRLGASQ